jgi:mannose-6-phosphate isomerase-like protein (cupin superfamily)
MKQAKIWGVTNHIWSGNNVEVHRIDIVQGGFCSKHKHLCKYNLFEVERGELMVEIWRQDIIEKTVLRPGDTTIVEPGLYHRFMAATNTVALEIYWVTLNEIDIVRENQGGINIFQ